MRILQNILNRLIVETYRYLHRWMPKRLRLRLKRWLDTDSQQWAALGTLQRSLSEVGYRVELDMGQWHQRWAYIKGYYPEPEVGVLLRQKLHNGSVFIDIGANIGFHTLMAAYYVGNDGQCIAVEPNPASYRRLCDHLAANHISHVETHQVGFGSEEAVIRLTDCLDTHVSSSLRPGADGENGCDVQVVRGDSLLATISANASGVCKIDTEGYELQVVQGMTDFIATHPDFMYVVEVTDSWLQDVGGTAQQLFDFFFAQNFRAYLFQLDTGELIQIEQPLDDFQYDVIFMRAS